MSLFNMPMVLLLKANLLICCFHTVTVFDAHGKPPPDGIFQGNQYKMGSYYSCKEVQSNFFAGKYVFASFYLAANNFTDMIKERNTPFLKLGLCFPASCSAEEIQVIINDDISQDYVSSPLKNTYDSHQLDSPDIGML